MSRKTPYRHKVRNHNRGDIRVHEYQRGKGAPAVARGKRRVVRGGGLPKNFDVTIIYDRGNMEQVSLEAKDYVMALSEGVLVRKRLERPKIIRMSSR